MILPAAGRSSRFGAKEKKVYAELDGRAVWLRAVEPFINRDDVSQTILAIAPEDRELFERRFRASVAFTLSARSSRESTSVPSRS